VDADAARRRAERDAASPVRVLITEADTVAAEYLATVLEKAGYRVDHVPNAEDSRVLLGRWRYGCWLLNTRLPDAGDALALVQELQPSLTDTRVVLLASLGTDRARLAEPNRQHVFDWLVKNDSRERILDVVKQAIGSALPQPAA
jgi:DNA-binding NtrC family response regulator